MTVGQWLPLATERLRRARADSPSLEAQLLAAHALDWSRSELIAHPEAELPELAAEALLQRRERREPMAYILGRKEFYGRHFEVGPGALVPRPETEVLVEAALELMRERPEIETCLEVGVGSGCVAVTLALESGRTVAGFDVSDDALRYARRNTETWNASVELVLSDRFAAFQGRRFDLLVANPPYLRTDEFLPPELEHEPTVALLAGEDGLDAYRWIAAEGAGIAGESAWLAVEIGKGAGPAVTAVCEAAGWTRIRSLFDLAGIERTLVFRRSAATG